MNTMADNRINLPSGSGGIVRYFDKSISKIEIAPEIAVGVIIALAVLLIIIHAWQAGVF